MQRAIKIAVLILFVAPWAVGAEKRLDKFDLVLETTSEYGWDHSGTKSWGGNWTRRAVNQASEEIRDAIRKMVNLEQLSTFSRQNLKKKLDGEVAGNYKDRNGRVKIGYEDGRSQEKGLVEVNRNNFVVLVDQVKMVKNSNTSITDKNYKGERSWEASLRVRYRIRIYGVIQENEKKG